MWKIHLIHLHTLFTSTQQTSYFYGHYSIFFLWKNLLVVFLVNLWYCNIIPDSIHPKLVQTNRLTYNFNWRVLWPFALLALITEKICWVAIFHFLGGKHLPVGFFWSNIWFCDTIPWIINPRNGSDSRCSPNLHLLRIHFWLLLLKK